MCSLTADGGLGVRVTTWRSQDSRLYSEALRESGPERSSCSEHVLPFQSPQPDSQQPHEVLTTVTSHSLVTQLRDQTSRSGLCRLLHLRVHIVLIDTQSKIKSKRNKTEMYNIDCKLSGMVLNFIFLNVLCVCMMMEVHGPQCAFGGPRTTVELVLFFHHYQVSRDETQVTRCCRHGPRLLSLAHAWA